MASEFGGDAERLVVLLEARIRDFEKNMAKASGTATRSYGAMRRGSQSATRQMEADMMRSTARINTALASTGTRIGTFGKAMAAGLVAPVAGLLTLTAALNGTKAALQKFGDIADKSAAAGIDAELFQSIAYQAKLAGVEIDAVAGGLASFAKNAGLAAEGKGRMVAQLRSLNPELLRNIQLATTQEERIRLVADAISSAADPARAAAIASATLGDAGVKLVAAFQGGAARIDEMLEKAKALGIVVDREVIARADELGDEFDTVTEIADNNLKQALVNLGPVIVGLTGYVAEWTKSLAIVLDQLKQVEDRTYLNPLQNKLIELENLRAPIMADLQGLQDQLAELDPSSGMAGVITAEIETKAARAEALMQEALIYQERIAQLQGKPKGPPTATKPPGAASATSPNMYWDAGIELANLNLPDAGKVDQVARGFRNVADASEAATLGIASSTEAVDRLREQFQIAEDMAKTFTSGLVDDVLDGRDVVASLGDAFGNLGRQLIQMAADQAISALFSNLLGAAFGGSMPGLGRLGSFSIGGMGSYASGTANTGGRRGEPAGVVHGQEAVIPLPDGGKVPVDIGGAKGGRQEVHVTVGLSSDAELHVTPMVERIAQRQIDLYDRSLPSKVDRVARRVVNDPFRANSNW